MAGYAAGGEYECGFLVFGEGDRQVAALKGKGFAWDSHAQSEAA
jgi:hypothetical protein